MREPARLETRGPIPWKRPINKKLSPIPFGFPSTLKHEFHGLPYNLLIPVWVVLI